VSGIKRIGEHRGRYRRRVREHGASALYLKSPNIQRLPLRPDQRNHVACPALRK
jgi:hypothetical protein